MISCYNLERVFYKRATSLITVQVFSTCEAYEMKGNFIFSTLLCNCTDHRLFLTMFTEGVVNARAPFLTSYVIAGKF